MSVCPGCASEDDIAVHQFSSVGSLEKNCICICICICISSLPLPSRLHTVVCLLCPGLAGQLGELPGTTVTVTG